MSLLEAGWLDEVRRIAHGASAGYSASVAKQLASEPVENSKSRIEDGAVPRRPQDVATFWAVL